MFPMQVVITVNSREELDALLGGPSYDQVVAALLATPLQSAKQVLEKFGVSNTTQLDKRQYAAVIQAAKDLK